jgi:hypothetical protein
MKTATIRDLRNEFARMVPEPKPKSFLGCGKGTAKLAPDFDEPLNLEWDAMK